jgi:hypothetical protein
VVIYFRREVAHIEEFESHPQHHLKAARQPVVHIVHLQLKTSHHSKETSSLLKTPGSFCKWHGEVG